MLHFLLGVFSYLHPFHILMLCPLLLCCDYQGDPQALPAAALHAGVARL